MSATGMVINVKPADWVFPFLDELRGHFSKAETLGVPALYVKEEFELFKKVFSRGGGLIEFRKGQTDAEACAECRQNNYRPETDCKSCLMKEFLPSSSAT